MTRLKGCWMRVVLRSPQVRSASFGPSSFIWAIASSTDASSSASQLGNRGVLKVDGPLGDEAPEAAFELRVRPYAQGFRRALLASQKVEDAVAHLAAEGAHRPVGHRADRGVPPSRSWSPAAAARPVRHAPPRLPASGS